MSIQFGRIEAAAPVGGGMSFRELVETLNKMTGPVDPEAASKLYAWTPTRRQGCKVQSVYFSAEHKATVAEYVRETFDEATGFTEVAVYTYTWKAGEYREIAAPQHSRRR